MDFRTPIQGVVRWVGTVSRACPLWVSLLALPVVALAAPVHVALDPTPRSCRVEGGFAVAVPESLAWQVLTDYDHIPEFVHSMISSKRERGADGGLQVRQIASGKFFLFRRRMQILLAIVEEPRRRVRFRDVLNVDFVHYVGEWRMRPDSAGIQVSYTLDAEPRSAFSRSLCRGVLKNTAEDLLEEVRTEMVRRSAAAFPAQ